MKNSFSSQLLRKIRNDIPIEIIIGKTLQIPNKRSDEGFRFLCPICSEFYTATMSKTNLARCFCCKKNFNNIDIVMIVTGFSFVKVVKYLSQLLHDL